MSVIKDLARPYYISFFDFIRKKVLGIDLIINFLKDYILYKRYSIIFKNKDLENKEADIILNYHSLEKGMLFKNMKKGFAAYRIRNLHKLLKDREIMNNCNRSQIRVGYQLMCQYYELHQNAGFEIENLFSVEQYNFYKSILNSNYDNHFNGIIEWTKESFFKSNRGPFEVFAFTRKSTRNFTGELISKEILNKVITLANTAPSVCNRQANSVYLIQDKTKIDKALKVQGGFEGYTEGVSQLLILTNNRKYYYTVGERNQFYIDGGVYLMNLLYALHYYKVGNCPANWGKTYAEEKALAKIISLPESEKIICFIPIGKLPDKFRSTLSKRRTSNENFKMI